MRRNSGRGVRILEQRSGQELRRRADLDGEPAASSRRVHRPPLSALRGLERRPIALYVAGNADILNDPQLSIVGSRNPTPAGRDTAFEFAESLAARGLGITSGLAEGIDSAAHRGALAAQGITVAVLGNGIDSIYPRSNQALSEQIRLQGALISEFPLGTPPRRANFPQRNRIIAALSLGTLVVEAARRSGSLITSRPTRIANCSPSRARFTTR